MKLLILVLMLAVQPGLAVAGEAEDILSGKRKAQNCTRCHGRNGVLVMARQSGWEGSLGVYVVRVLAEYRDGRRQHAVMTSVAGGLSDRDIHDIGVWYQSLGLESAN